MMRAERGHSAFRALVEAIALGDAPTASQMLSASPELAHERSKEGASRHLAKDHYLDEIEHDLYVGDTALHIAAAAYQKGIAADLIAKGGDVRAKNRHGAEPIHYAADGVPGSRGWNPRAQEAMIDCLIKAGADPNAVDKRGVTPLHRAVRTRCAAAVKALLAGGANARAGNKNGSSPMLLASHSTGRGGSGSIEAKAEQQEILRLLKAPSS
ncbi:MAG: ankyrin repeat domain-containing protein [Hyphomicrobiaceae bacterium]|nr:ankyrin repeat domain-containing protein [Hyphomicrobiaceae bacterium]